MRCRMADEPVVVINPQPMKAGNSLEDKTEETLHLLRWGVDSQKRLRLRRGEDKPKYASKESKCFVKRLNPG